ncbi:MAG: ice-binding family protein, partial [Anaerolineales bacterium]|nr:ice-binding family protein [Anaerolineales bacterium]
NHRHLATLAYSAGRVCLVLVFALGLTGGVAQAAPLAATAPGLGTAANFAVLANAAVTCTESTITGDVGEYPRTAVTQTNSIIAGTIHAGDETAAAAYTDFLSAYNALEPCDVVLTGSLAGLTLAPGVYCFDAAVAEMGGVLTLSGPSNGTWIFKIGTGALTGTNFSVVMAGGGQAGNVYWRVADDVTLTNSNFLGTILAGAAITITDGTFDGRALAKAAVTLTGTAVTAPTPVSPTPTPVTPTPTPEPTPTTGQAPVDLRSAGSFVILSKSGITNVPASAITGDVGTSPITGAAITGLDCVEVTGTIYTVNAAGPACRVENPVLLTAAVSDMETAYTDAAGRTLPDFTELGAGNIDGMTLAPGLYKWGTGLLIPTGVTLKGGANDVWIFQIAG